MTQYNKRYNIVLPDGRTEEWTQDQLTQAGGALMTKYPGAEVSEIMEQEQPAPQQQQENNIFKPMDVGEMSKRMTSGNALQNFADQAVYVARNPESEYAAEDARRQQEYKESKLERYKEYKRDAETPEEKSFVKGEIKTLKQDIEAGKSDPRVIKGKETYYDAVAESQADIIAHTNVSLGDEWTGSYGERLSALWEAKALTQLTPQQTAGIEDKVFTDEQRAKENYVYAREFAQQAQDLTMSPIDVDQKGQVKQAFGYAAKKYVSDPTNAVPAINSQMMFRIREIMEKLQAEHVRLGEPEYDDKDLRDILTDDEATLFEAYVAKTQAEAIRQNDKLRGYQGANIALESMPFMVEMLVGNKLIGGTEKVAKYALSKALKGQMNKLVAKGAGKFVQKLVRYGEGYAMDLGLRATKVGLMTTFAPSTKDRIGEKMVEVENGQLARTRAGAITSGYLSNYKEFFTETAGEIYGKAWDAALDLTGIDNIISKYVTSNIPDLVKKGWKAFNNSVLVDAGFNGVGEILEEVEGAFLDRVAGDKEAWREFWKGDNLLEMIIGFAPMTGIGLVQSAGQVAAQAYVDNQITDAERSFKRAYSGLGWTDTQWKNWFNYAREHADADVTARSVADMLRDFENRYVDQVLGDDSRMTDDEKLSHLEAAQKMGSALLMEYTARSAESALEESEKENIKNDILKKLNPTERTNIKFWHDDADKTVSLGTASYNGKPAQVYIVSEDASGVHAIAPDGKSINVPAGKVKRRVDMSLDQYLTAIARSSRAELEELSKGKSERALRKGVQKDLESGKVMEFDLGGEKRAATYGGMQNGMVIAHFEDVVELNGKTGTDIPVSVEEAARALGMNVFSYDEMRKNGIDHLAKGMALRNDLNDRFHGRGFISDGQQYRFRRIYKNPYKEAGEDMVDVVAYDQDGMMRNVSMKVSDLESQTPVSVEQSSYSLQDGVTATGEQLPMKHLEDGSMVVDEQALLEQDLQAWAKYHDEITGDGGADTWSYLTDVLSSDVAGRIAELREGLKAERLFSKREQIREEIARNEDKLRKIVEVKKGYVARKVAGLNNTGVQVIVSDSESVMNDMANCSESERGSMSYAMETGMQVRGVYSRSSGQVFLFADMIETIDQAGITFIHEQEHSVTHRNGNNRKLVHSLLGEAFDGLDIEKLEQSAGKEKTKGIEAVIALRSTFADIIHKLAGTGFYDNVSIYTLADEVISHMVEASYAKGMTVTQAMMGYGIPEDIANLVETITSENRYERREEYYPASESAGDAYGSQRSGVDSAEDAAGAGEGQQLERPDAGSVPGSEGEEALGFSVAGDENLIGNEEPDKNGFDSLQRAEIGKALGGELEIGDGSSALVFSVTAQVTGVGFDYVIEDNGAVSFVHPDGRKFDAQHHITADDLKSVERSAFKYLENYCHKHGYYSDEDSERMWQKYADMLNAYLDKGAGEGGYGKLSSEWQWIADSVKRVFRAVATNSDKQYSKSLDITRVCKKNEAVINAISVLQRRMGYGITPGQVMDIYYNTIEAGYQAPCPVCYVFTRYIRNGQYATIMLNGKRKYGDKLQDVSKMSVKERAAAVEYWLSEYDKQVAENKANENEIKAAKNDITVILDEIDRLSHEYGLPKTSKERKAEIRKEVDRLDAQYKSSLNVVSQASLHSWITQFAIHKVSKDNANKPGVIARKAANGKMQYWDLWEDQKPFPDEIALDLRETATAMTEFAAVQRFRNSRGAAAGKEITFAADNGVGEVALMLANEKDPRNYLQEAVDAKNEKTRRALLKKAYDKLAKAHIYAQQQTLRGGQRMWSWSDNIERLAPDVFINILQLEMLGGGMQTYSKQLEGIKSVATMDAYVNGSLMGHGIGYMEVPEDMIGVQDGKYVLNKPITYTNERKNEEVVAAQAGDALYQKDGKFYALVFDDVVGVQAFAKPDIDDNGKVKKGLLDLNAELDKAGNIIVGMDDLHVIMSMADDRIFFIIPWHASGANNHLLAQMYRYLGSNKVKGRDFTNVQEEKYLGKTKEEETDELADEPEIGEEATEETVEESNGAGKVTPAMVEFWENHKNETDFPCGLGSIESGDGNGNLSEKQIEYKALRDAILKGYPVSTGKKDKNGKEKTKLVPIREAATSGIAEAVEMFDKIRADIFLSQVEQTVYESVDTHLMTSGDTGFIYPYEYWDKKSTFSTADINGARYLEYCRRMGYKPKFCGTLNPNAKEDYGNFADYKGYWKLLIDRRMYDRLGNYQDLVKVNTSKFTPDLIDPSKTKKEFIVTKVADAEGNESIAQKTYEQEMNRPGGLSTVNYGLDLKEAVRLYELAKENPEAYYAEIGQKPASEGLNYSVSEETPGDLLYSIIGEKGARMLDEYEETTTRLDNLNVARDMEQQLSPDWKAKSNDAALKIKMATGWERGSDGKWRYEVEDVDIKPLSQWLESKKKLKLRDVVSANNPVMKAYPDLLDIDVLKGKSTKFWKGSYNSKDKTIELPFGMLKRFDIESLEENPDNSFTRHFKRTLLHEVQHAVQYREGFARGGNPDMLSKDAPREQIDNLTRTADEMAERYRNMSESERLSSEGKTLYADTLRMYDRINYLNRAWRIGESGYKALGGEVESRNVESRMMIPMEERRNQLLAQTEDVDRKQQLLMFEDIEAANSLFSVAPASDNAEELRESNLAFSIVTDQAEIDRLNNEPYVELYHAMQKITMPDGKTYLFPPMAAIQGDGYVQGIPVNEDGRTINPIWEKADERQDLAFRYTKGKKGVRVPEDAELTDGTISIGSGKNKKEVPWKFYEGQPLAGEYNKETGEMEPSWYFSLKKGNKGDKGKKLQDLDKVAFDPYQHSAFNPVNDQFTTAYDRSHLVIVKVRVPASEANGESGYKAEKAKLGVGTHEWTGGKLKTKNRRQVVLSRWDKPVEILSDEEVAEEWKKVLDENNLKEVPFNIVTPGQREALIDLGVKIGKPTNDNAGKAARVEYEAWKSTTQEGLNFSVANSNQDVFISNALASLYKIPMKSGNAQAWVNKIQQAGGLKKEEDKWIGLTDWLKEQKGDISKGDVAEYIREHQVRIREVNYGMNLPEDAFEFDYVDDIDYAEVLINDWEKAVALYNKSNEDQIDVNDQTDENWEKVEEFGRSLLDNTINPQRENYTTDGLENKREIALVVPTIEPYKESDDIHFGDAGEGRAIGWARFGDAMDEDGNRVLVIDEVQSNRHQDGKEKGYSEKGFPSKMDAYSAKEKAFEDFDRVFSELSGKYSEEEIYEMRMSEDDNASYKDVLEKRKEANRIYNIAISSVPDAPFRDSWDALIMKRMLRLASEEGYDKIAWTNGQMQSDRYDLTKVIGDFYYKPNGDGTYKVSAALNQRRAGYTEYSDLNYDSLTVDGIGEIFGKEIAVKVSEGKGRKGYSHNNESDWVTFSGRDLKMANEGMRYFYDEKLVNWMNKYGKKWDIKVSDLRLPGLENEEGWHSVDVTPEMKESVMQGQLMFSANNSLVGIHNITEENLRKALRAGGLANPSVAVVDISQRGHDQFGAISLILPSYMIDKTSGYNAGTWTDDVWTPIYPPTRTIFTEQGYKNFVDAINKYGSSKSFNKFYAENERDQAYLGKDPDLMWLFLNEVKGIDTTTYEHPGASGAWEDIMDDYKTADKFLKDYQSNEKLRGRTLSLILSYVDRQIEKNHPEIAQITKQEDETFREYIRRKHDAKRPFLSEYMDENGNYTSQTIKDAFNEQKRLYKVNGLVDNLGTKNRALSIINRRGWSDEYWKWHGKRLEELGVKEEIRDGNDRNGNARWKPATVENASKAMNNQALTGANTMGGWGTFISKIARHMTTLDSIRAEKGHLGSDEDARKAKEKFSDMAIMLHDRQPSLDLWNGGAATALANIVKNAGNDIAKFLKTRYHIELDESELAELEQFVSDVKNMKSDYFETKFQRPVDINEFVAAVVPNKTSQDLIDKLESYGLAVRKYNPNKEGDLWRAQKLASREEGIRFSAVTITPETRAEMEQIQALARLNGTYLKAPNGADTNLNPEQWAMARTKKFKAWFGDWEVAYRLEKLKNSSPLIASGNEYQGKYELNRDSAQQYIINNLRTSYTISDTGESIRIHDVYEIEDTNEKDIQLANRGAKKVTSHSAWSDAHLKSVALIPDLIKKSIFITEEPAGKSDAKFDSYRYYLSGLNMGGEDYTVLLVIGVKQGKFYYDHYLTQIEKGSLIETANSFIPTEDEPLPSFATSKDSRLWKLLQKNYSKIVDENGEPMVVYRGQDWSEDANGKMTSGLFVSLDRDFAEGYGEVMPLFVRSINPFNGEKDAESLRPFVEENFDAITKEYDEFFDEGEGYEDSESLMNALKENWWIAYEQSDILRNEIIRRGYDSIFIREDADNIWLTDSNQIKSATENNGEFSRENDDIRFSVADNNSNTSGIIKPIYTGLFVQGKSGLEERYPSELPNKYYDHMTSVFRPGEIDAATLGEESDLHIIGRLTTDKVDALLVESEDTNNEHPHITLATADGVKPVASNKEITENTDKIVPLDDYIRVRKGANMGGSNIVYGLNFSAGRKKVHFTGEDIADLFAGKPLAENLAELSKAIYEDKFSDYSDEFRQKMTDIVLTEGDPIKAMASFIHGIAAKPDLTQDEQKFVENLYQYVLSLTSIDNFGINDTLWAMDEYITSREQKNNDSAQDSPVQDNANYLDEFIDAAKDAQDDIDSVFEMEREALNEFMSIEKAISKTRNVDRLTAKRMVRLIDSVLAGGLIDNESRSEVKSLLRIVRDAVGMADITPEIKKLRRIIVNNTMRRLGNMYNKILEKKAVKVSSKKIVEQGSVDLFGQKMKEAYMEGRDMFIEVDGEYQASDRLKKLIEDNANYDASGEVDSEMEARFIGYSVAKDYIEGLRTGLNNIDLLQQERSDTYESYNNEEITGREKNVRVANIDQRLQEEKESILLPMMDHIDRLSNFFSDRHKKAIEFLEADRRRKYDIFKDADMDLTGVSDSQESITREERSNWHKVTNSDVFRVLTASLGNFDTMLKALGRRSPNGEGFLWNRFMRQWIDSTNEEYEGISEADTILNAKASEVFGRKMLWKDLYEVDKKLPKATITYRSISGKEETRELGQASLLYIILASGMADGRMKLEAMGISQDRVNNIKSLIDPRFLELGNWMVNEFLPSRREKYNARHEEIFGASMSQVENYFPIVVNKNARYNEFEATRVGQEQRLGNTITGGIIKRTVNSLPLDIIGANAFSIAYGNVQQMEHWYAFSRFNRDMKDLLSNTSVRNRLRHMESPYGSGETFLDNFEKIVTIAEGEYRPAKVIDSKAVNLGRNFTAACISFRLHTAMKQVLSFPAFISEANTVELAKCLANPAASWNWAMENMPVFKKRWQSRQAGNHILSEADDFKAKALEWAARVGMTPNAFVDAITVSIGARAIYLTKKKRYLDYGFSEEQAHMKALQDAMIGYNETQQSNEGAFLSEIQKQNTWFTTSLTMFRNSSFGYGRMAMNATIDLVRRQQDGYKEEAISAIYNRLVKEGLSSDKALDAAQKEYKRQGFQDAIRIANFTVGVTFAWNLGSYAVYLLFGKDDDKKKEMLRNAFFKGLAGGWAEGLMGGSMVSEAIANWLMGKQIGSLELGTMPVLDALDKLIGNLDKKDWWMAAHDFMNMMVQATTGVNPQAIEEVAMSIYDIAGGDLGLFKEIGLGIARLLQVPQSQLDEFYFDEIDMTGDRAMEMTVEEIATIYAERRAARQTGVVTPLYPDSDMKKLVDKYRKKYEDEIMNRSMLGVRYDDIRNYSESVVKKADRLLERANGGDESADRKLMELYARDEYGRAVTFLEKDEEISKMFKDAMDTGNLDEMRKLITDANDEKTILEMDFANESPDYLEQMSNRYLGYTKGFLARMSDIESKAPRMPKELTERQQAEYDVAIKYVNAGKASIAEGNKLKKEDQARYDEALAKVNELTNIEIPDDIRSSREWQVYNKLKNSGKVVKGEFIPNTVEVLDKQLKKEKDPEKKKILKARIKAEKLMFAQRVYDLMQDD